MRLAVNNEIDLERALSGTGFTNVATFEINKLIQTGISLIFVLGAITAFFYLLWGSFEWITSAGEKENLEKAKKKITNALLGLAILFCIFAIIILIEVIFKVDIRILNIPTLNN